MIVRYAYFRWSPPVLTEQQKIEYGRRIHLQGKSVFVKEFEDELRRTHLQGRDTQQPSLAVIFIGIIFFSVCLSVIYYSNSISKFLLVFFIVLSIYFGSAFVAKFRFSNWVDSLLSNYLKNNHSQSEIDYSKYEKPTRFVSNDTLATKEKTINSSNPTKAIVQVVEARNNYVLCPQCATKLERGNGRDILCGTCGYKGEGIDVPSKFSSKGIVNIQPQIELYEHKEKFKGKVEERIIKKLSIANLGNIQCPHCKRYFDGDKESNQNCPYCAVPINELGI